LKSRSIRIFSPNYMYNILAVDYFMPKNNIFYLSCALFAILVYNLEPPEEVQISKKPL